MHWRIAWKMLWWMEVPPTPKPSPLTTKETRKTKEMRNLNLFWHQGPTEILFWNIYRYSQLQHFSCLRQLWFYSKRQQRHFCSNSRSAVNWNSYKCCSATNCCRRSHMAITVIEHKNAFVKRRCFLLFFIGFFYYENRNKHGKIEAPVSVYLGNLRVGKNWSQATDLFFSP